MANQKIKEEIKQRIQKERGEYTRKRRKKYLYYKNRGWLDLYYQQKRIPIMPKEKSIIQGLTLWQRIYIVLVLGFKRIWQKIKSKLRI